MTKENSHQRAYLLCRFARESGLYNGWIDRLPLDYEVVVDCPVDWHPPADAGIVIAHEHFIWETAGALRRIYEMNTVPTLVLADGVLEFRNTWQNPTIPDGSMYQPLLAHKIACLGNATARWIESWGNAGKVEIVGLPRLDALIERDEYSRPKATEEFRLLVTTATTPAFNDSQRQKVVESLKSIADQVAISPVVTGRRLQIDWRLTDGLERDAGLPPQNDSELSLWEAIESADAVITTPSTIFLESALLGRPTAILDFTNSPQYVPSAWTISAPCQVADVLNELANPPASKMLFQQGVLADNLRCETAATPRMIELVSRMVAFGVEQRSQHRPVSMPWSILPPASPATHSDSLDMHSLFPDNEMYQIQQVGQLQAELNQAILRLDQLPRELAEKNSQITQLQSALDESRRRVADVRARLFKLRKVLGIGKENVGEV